MGRTHRGGGPIDVKRFQGLLKEPLNALGVEMPTTEVCKELLMWMPMPRIDVSPENWGLSKKPHEKAVAFINALDEVDEYFTKLRNNLKKQASVGLRKGMLKLFDASGPERLARLRSVLSESKDLFQAPEPFEDSWHDAARACNSVFWSIVERSGRTVHVGFSAKGPRIRFVRDALIALDFKNITEAAIAQHLVREEKRIPREP